jgi:hypothetical protein
MERSGRRGVESGGNRHGVTTRADRTIVLLAVAGASWLGVTSATHAAAVAADVGTTANAILGGKEPDGAAKALRHLLDLTVRIATDGHLPEGVRNRLEVARDGGQSGRDPDRSATVTVFNALSH